MRLSVDQKSVNRRAHPLRAVDEPFARVDQLGPARAGSRRWAPDRPSPPARWLRCRPLTPERRTRTSPSSPHSATKPPRQRRRRRIPGGDHHPMPRPRQPRAEQRRAATGDSRSFTLIPLRPHPRGSRSPSRCQARQAVASEEFGCRSPRCIGRRETQPALADMWSRDGRPAVVA